MCVEVSDIVPLNSGRASQSFFPEDLHHFIAISLRRLRTGLCYYEMRTTYQ